MKILFVHQNFPGQFPHVARALAADPQNEVVALSMREVTLPGVRVIPYAPKRGSSKGIHPWVTDFETKVIRAEEVFRVARRLRNAGFTPDLVVVHPGWGEGMFVRQVWPNTRVLLYGELFYRREGVDVGFDPEFETSSADEVACRVEVKNANNWLHFAVADAGLSPTEWQKSTFPEPFRSKIRVMHDGIDTAACAPSAEVRLGLPGKVLTRADEVVTFVSRQLEPYRGFHSFMRALPELLRLRPRAEVVIVGGEGRGYGGMPAEGGTWKAKFLKEVEGSLDLSRVHFVGQVPRDQFQAILQISRAHVYLTYPFVLSWSLIEAMSTAAPIVASRTAPVEEVIADGETGLLVDFFSPREIAEKVAAVLDDRALAESLGQRARALALARYDLKTVCLPGQLQIIRDAAQS